MVTYQKVIWKHQFPDEPILLYSEVSDDGTETRKIEVFRDGRTQYADADKSTGDTLLSEKPLPSVEEIRDQKEFSICVIQEMEFEEIWRRVTDCE
jgi:uncharacterized protein DUF6881